MSTYRELIYMSKDLLKLKSDDSYYTNEHILFLLDKVRAVILEQKYKKNNSKIEDSNTQTICVELESKLLVDNILCSGKVLVSKDKLPSTIITSPIVYTVSPFVNNEITYVTPDRFKYVRYNKWLNNIIYSTEFNNYLYIKSNNPNYLELNKVIIKGVFNDTVEAEKLKCNTEDLDCNYLDREYPLEETLQTSLIEMVVKILSIGLYKPADNINNAQDDLASLMQFIRNNAKSNLQKQIES